MTGPKVRMRARRVTVIAVLLATIGSVGAMQARPSGAESPNTYAQIITLGGNGGGPSACQLARVDLEKGAVQAIGPVFDNATQGCPFDMARTEDHLYGILNYGDDTTPSILVRINRSTGARTPVGSLGFATNLAGLAIDDDGHFLLYAQNTDPACAGGTGQPCLYRIDPDSGAATLIALGATDTQILGATATCTHVLTDLFLGGNDSPPSSQLASLNTSTAVLTPKPNGYGGIFMTGLEHDTDDTLYGVGVQFGETGPGAPSSYTIDPNTGLATPLAAFTLGPNQILAALAIGTPDCEPDDPTTTTTSVPPAEPIASPIRFTG